MWNKLLTNAIARCLSGTCSDAVPTRSLARTVFSSLAVMRRQRSRWLLVLCQSILRGAASVGTTDVGLTDVLIDEGHCSYKVHGRRGLE